jgi:hypothetical protein
VDPASTYLLNLLADQIGIGGPSVPIALAAKGEGRSHDPAVGTAQRLFRLQAGPAWLGAR